MGKSKVGKSCGCRTRIVSEVVQKMPKDCFDVCVTPLCGMPSVLSLMAPVIYDEIGINLCTSVDLDVDISIAYPTAKKATVQVISISYDYGEDNVEVTQLTYRPNCYAVTLSNLLVQFAISLYDEDCRLVDTIFTSATYLPSDTTTPTYDEDTNPSSVTLELFAPYGVTYDMGTQTPVLNYFGYLTENNYVQQGLNLYAFAKVLDLDTNEDEATIGLTLIIQSVYFTGYRVATEGKISIPKGCMMEQANDSCMDFVTGDLLDLAIKPLDLSTIDCD